MNPREFQAEEAITRYQLEVRKAQLLALAELVVTREEAQRILAEATMLDALGY